MTIKYLSTFKVLLKRITNIVDTRGGGGGGGALDYAILLRLFFSGTSVFCIHKLYLIYDRFKVLAPLCYISYGSCKV